MIRVVFILLLVGSVALAQSAREGDLVGPPSPEPEVRAPSPDSIPPDPIQSDGPEREMGATGDTSEDTRRDDRIGGSPEDRPIGLIESRPIGASEGAPTPTTSGRALTKTITALGGVISLILALHWGIRAYSRRQGGLITSMHAGGRAPSGILEVLGRYPLGRGLTLVLLKVDQRILLISQSNGGRLGGTRMETLCEIDEPEDVASILLKSHTDEEDSLAARFSAILRGEDEESRRVMRSTEPVETRVSPSSLLRDRLEQVREWQA